MRRPADPTIDDGGHCSVDDLLDYLYQILDPSRAELVEIHLADCMRCAELLGRTSRTALLVDNWSEETHAEATRRLAITNALALASDQPENHQWATRLSRWAKQFAENVQAVLGVVVRPSGDASLSFLHGQARFLAPGGWEFVPAVMAFGESIRIATIRGAPEARVEVRAQLGRGLGRDMATVRVSLPAALQKAAPGQLAILINQKRPKEVQVKPLHAQKDGSSLAEFIAIEPGEYIVILEPLSPLENPPRP